MLTFQPYYDPTPQSNWNQIFVKKNVFNDEMISRLENSVLPDYSFSKGRTGARELGTDTDSYKTNNRDIAYIQPNENSHWMYDLLFPIALEANQMYYGFDIDIVTDPIHYVIYPEDGGHLDWHMDNGAHGTNRRKLAMTVQLSDYNDYEGGDFQIWGGGKEFVTLPREKGDIVVFPTFLLHRVTPITKGIRKCLVFWTGGRPFK